jgi:hypothetical protein
VMVLLYLYKVPFMSLFQFSVQIIYHFSSLIEKLNATKKL